MHNLLEREGLPGPTVFVVSDEWPGLVDNMLKTLSDYRIGITNVSTSLRTAGLSREDLSTYESRFILLSTNFPPAKDEYSGKMARLLKWLDKTRDHLQKEKVESVIMIKAAGLKREDLPKIVKSGANCLIDPSIPHEKLADLLYIIYSGGRLNAEFSKWIYR